MSARWCAVVATLPDKRGQKVKLCVKRRFSRKNWSPKTMRHWLSLKVWAQTFKFSQCYDTRAIFSWKLFFLFHRCVSSFSLLKLTLSRTSEIFSRIHQKLFLILIIFHSTHDNFSFKMGNSWTLSSYSSTSSACVCARSHLVVFHPPPMMLTGRRRQRNK